MLPTDSELRMAKKCGFKLVSVTNFSFCEIADIMGINVNLMAVVKEKLGETSFVKLDDYSATLKPFERQIIAQER